MKKKGGGEEKKGQHTNNVDINKMLVPALRDELRQRGKSSDGVKKDLQERLCDALGGVEGGGGGGEGGEGNRSKRRRKR